MKKPESITYTDTMGCEWIISATPDRTVLTIGAYTKHYSCAQPAQQAEWLREPREGTRSEWATEYKNLPGSVAFRMKDDVTRPSWRVIERVKLAEMCEELAANLAANLASKWTDIGAVRIKKGTPFYHLSTSPSTVFHDTDYPDNSVALLTKDEIIALASFVNTNPSD